MGVFSMAIVAIWGAMQISPPERVFTNYDMCVAAKEATVKDLQASGVKVLSARCDLRQLAEIKR